MTCPTCGPTRTEQHPRRADVTRCSNCKEWLTRPTCHCTVVTHPAGEAWVTHTADNTCDQHRHGQRYEGDNR